MIAYLQNASNWPNQQPLVTDFSVGSVAYTILSAVAVGLDQISMQQFNDEQQSSILTATNSSLDSEAANWNVTRNAALAANGQFLLVKNVAAVTNIPIPQGSVITTLPAVDGSSVQFTTNTTVTLPVGATSVSVNATCSNPGPGQAGNLVANTQLVLGSAVPGIDGVQLQQAITNGVDAESDDSLRSRTLESMQNPPGGGSPTDYQLWAEGVSGVTKATVLRLNRGPGTVDILIQATNGVPSASLILQVQTVINGYAPATADALVIGPTAVAINVTASLTLTSGYTLSAVTSAVQTAITNYINNLQPGGTVYNSGLVAAVVAVTGVMDCQITISVGGTTYTNYTLASESAAESGTITVQAA